MIAFLLLLLLIPAQPLSGSIQGGAFTLQSAVFSRENLILTSAEGLTVRIWAPWTDVPAGLTFTADKTSRVWDSPVVELVKDDQLLATYDPTHGYDIRLEFATVVNGQLPTRLGLQLPDGSWLAGEFSLQILEPQDQP